MISTPTALTNLASLGGRQLLNRLVHASSPHIPSLSRAKCSGLGLPLSAIVKGNATNASNLYRGIFELGGCKAVLAGTSIFELPHERPESFDHALNSFGWLHDLEAGGTQLYKVFGRGLINEWLELKIYRTAAARKPQTIAQRSINWVQCAPYLLDGASSQFEADFYDSLTRQARHLLRKGVNHYLPKHRLMSVIALVYTAFGTLGMEALQKTALAKLSSELDQQVLPDGGHISRSGQTLVDLLLLLVPLRDALVKARIEVPTSLNSALDRMVPMVRFMSHGDGGLAVFHGVSRTSTGRIKAVIERDELNGKIPSSTPFSGYQRLSQGRSSIIMDTGAPALPGHNKAAASSPLAFEFCDGPHRIVVNCGSRQDADQHWRSASRLTSAHSTLCMGDDDAHTILDNAFFRTLFDTPVLLPSGTIDAETISEAEGGIVTACHTAYEKKFGLIHQRQIYLNAAGTDLRGEDQLTPSPETTEAPEHARYAIRFHVHPSIKTSLSRDGSSIMLVLPNKRGWTFSAKGGRIDLMSSVYLPDSRSARPTQQIVVTAATNTARRIAWAFKKMKKPVTTEVPSDNDPSELPLGLG